MKLYSRLLLFASILALSGFAYAVSMTTSYQGYLEDAVGEPLSSTVDMSFALYDEAGVNLWSESHPQVVVNDGVFSLILGSSIPFDGRRFLGIVVGGDAVIAAKIAPQTIVISKESTL